MSAHYDVLAVSSPENMLEEVSIHEGVRTASVYMTRSITPAQDIKALWELYRLFKREKPAIVHTHTPKAGLRGMIASRLAGVPIRLHTVAGMPLMESKGVKKKILQRTEQLTYLCATKVYPNSRNLAEFICLNKFCNKNKLKVLGNGSSNGIDTDYFQCTPAIRSVADELKKRWNLAEENFIFLFIGRVVRDKGIEELVEAFIQLKNNFTGIKLLIVGPYEQHLDPISETIKRTIELDPDIIHEGFQQDIRPYLSLSHVLTFPSYREGFPNVPMQAGCFDLPSIVTDINGCNEIIEHENNGLIIPVKDPEALRLAMLSLMSDKALYAKLKRNARKMILDRYDQNKFWNLLLDEYQRELKDNEILS